MQRVQFKSAGVGPDNTPRYDLWIDNEPVRTGLEIDEVIRILAERDEDELPRRVPAAHRTPEDGRSWQRRDCPKAL